MKRSTVLSFRWAIVLIFGCSLQANAQERRASAPDPMISTYTSTRARTAQIPILDRSIAVDLEGTSLEQALAQIAARAGLRLTYSTDLLPDDHRISLHASSITAANAVRRVLRGTSLDLLVSPSGHAVLVPCSPTTCGPRVRRPGAQAIPGAGMSYAHLRIRHAD
jgi:hypothetical protein